MPKKTNLSLIIAILLIGLVVGGYFLLKNPVFLENKVLKEAGEAADKIIESATKGVLPSMSTNPLEDKPDINPADKANPFKDIKTNPFE